MRVLVKDHPAIIKALRKINGRGTVRTIDLKDVLGLIRKVEARLINSDIPLILWRGLSVYHEVGPAPVRKGVFYTSQIEIKRIRNEWFLVWGDRIEINKGHPLETFINFAGMPPSKVSQFKGRLLAKFCWL